MEIISEISNKVYLIEEEGLLIYEKTSNVVNKPFWGITANVINTLNGIDVQYKVKLVWTGHGGILISKEEIIDFISKSNKSKDGDYKINYGDLKNFKATWDDNLVQEAFHYTSLGRKI